METLSFTVRNQHIQRTDRFYPVKKSKNYLYASFDFKTTDWNGKIKNAIFAGSGIENITVILEYDKCLVPWEVLECDSFTVSVFAGDLITADTAYVKMWDTGYKEGKTPEEPTPTVYQQLLDKAEEVKEVCKTAVAESAASAESARTSEQNAKAIAESTKDYVELAKEYAESASTSEQNASQSEESAKQSEANAKSAETNAKQSALQASNLAEACAESEKNAKASATEAALSETNAKASENETQSLAKEAAISEANAKQSESNALAFANKASDSADSAKMSADNAKQSEATAAESAQKAVESAESAAESEKIANDLVTTAGLLLNISDLSYDQISRIVRAGKAADIFIPGDQIITTYTATNGRQYEMPFDVVNIQDVTLEDGTVVPGMIIQSHYATLEGIQFDAPEPDNLLGKENVKDNNVASYGYNRWSESGIRAWLNSNAEAGGWFGTTFEREGKSVTRREADVAPTQLNSVNGFMRGLPEEFLRILKKVKITTSTNTVTDDGVLDTTYDMFFLPSLENICVNPQATAGDEGGNWDYWAQRVGTTKRPQYQDFPRGITYAIEDHTSAQHVRLRSANRGLSSNAWCVYTSGSASYNGAHNPLRCAPACVIC